MFEFPSVWTLEQCITVNKLVCLAVDREGRYRLAGCVGAPGCVPDSWDAVARHAWAAAQVPAEWMARSSSQPQDPNIPSPAVSNSLPSRDLDCWGSAESYHFCSARRCGL